MTLSPNPSNEELDEIIDYLSGKAVVEAFQTVEYGEGLKLKEDVIAEGRRFLDEKKAEAKHRLQALIAAARKAADNNARNILHAILSEDVDSELDHSDIEAVFESRLKQQRSEEEQQ